MLNRNPTEELVPREPLEAAPAAQLQNLGALGPMEEAPENGAGVSAASETRAVAKYAAPDQKNLSRAFTLDPPAFNLTRLDAPTAPRLATKIAKEVFWWAGILACNFCWACCCCRNLQTEVRAILMLTSIETCAAVAYAINLLITALGTDAEVETSVYYIGTMLIVISSMLWVFVLSSIRFVAPLHPLSPSDPSPVPSATTPALARNTLFRMLPCQPRECLRVVRRQPSFGHALPHACLARHRAVGSALGRDDILQLDAR